MKTFEKEEFLDLAGRYKDYPKIFINTVDDYFRKKPISEKANEIFELGHLVLDHSFYILAFVSWNRALEYYIKSGNKRGEEKNYGTVSEEKNLVQEHFIQP